MAQAGVRPTEVEIKKQMDLHRADMATLNGATRKTAMVKLADLELRYNIARAARQKLLKR